MPRRKRLIITPSDDRYAGFSVGVDAGDAKWARKKDTMKKHARGYGLRWAAAVDEIIANVLDRAGVIGRVRMSYFTVGRKIARWVTKYWDQPDDTIDAYVRPIAESMRTAYRLEQAVVEAIYNELKNRRTELASIARGR